MPHQLLQEDPTNPDSPQKETLAAADWTAILGNDPLNYDYTGIDVHMIESYQPRIGLPLGPSATPDPRAATTGLPIRERSTCSKSIASTPARSR